MSVVVLYRIDHEKRMRRYYGMDVQPDLLRQLSLLGSKHIQPKACV